MSGEIFAVKIPVLGTLRIIMEYSIDFEIQKPSSIEAGNSATVSILPRTGTLYTTFFLDNSDLGTITSGIDLGQKKSIPLVAAAGADIHVFALPTANIQSSVTGPATISPRSANMDSIRVQDFQVRVQDNIGTSNQIQVKFPVTLYVAASGGVDLILTEYDLDPVLVPLTAKTLTETISIYKNYNTQLFLQVSDSSRSGYIKVYPQLTTTSGQTVQSSDISIYVDGKYTTKVRANSWSSDIYTDSGRHNIEARFSETISSSNSAITYKSSSQMQSFNVKAPPPTPTQTPQTTKSDLPCDPGTHEENGLCVPDNGGGCLIATATYGSELAPQVQMLREIRDNSLLQTQSGQSFMQGFNWFYYSFSPAVADYERQNPVFKEAVKLTITPLLASLSLLNYVDLDSEESVLGYGIGIILMNVGMYFVAPIVVVSKFFHSYHNLKIIPS
ncbi:MAG: hypothetical protein NPMRTH1_760024 [Nitrosopumilales archaeon]|nr:MAG: hypothetical protein NPMRTH1_760024 [Nitrosopumilales archaeon]